MLLKREENAMKAVFVTNICTHYRAGAFSELARRISAKFYFYSDGSERYWEKKNATGGGTFEGHNLSGFYLFPRVRITPELVRRLLSEEYDVAIKCINGRFALPVTFLLAKLRKKKFILWQTLWYHPRTFFHTLSFPLLQYIWRHSDALVTYGEHGRDYLLSHNVPRDKVFIAWQAVDNALFNRPIEEKEKNAIRTELRVEGKRILLFVGQLIPVKGLEYLIDAYKLMNRKDTVLLIVGAGPLEKTLKERSRELPDVRFLGYRKQQELPGLYSVASALILPSVTMADVKEAWGLVINEGMNQGCPAVVTDAVGAGVGGLVRDGVNGFVVPERNAQALSSALTRILADPSLEAVLRKNAREIIQGWDFSRWASGFVDAIQYSLRNAR